MFDKLRESLNLYQDTNGVEASMIMESITDALEDDVLENIAISKEEDAKIMSLLDKIPGDDFSNTEKLTDEELIRAANAIRDPTIEELISDEL